MTTTIIIDTKNKSEKIPFSLLYCVAGLPLIVLYVKRLENSGSKVLVTTSLSKKDDDLVAILKQFKISYLRGPLGNKSKKFINSKNKKKYFIIKNILDNIFIDGYIINKILKLNTKSKDVTDLLNKNNFKFNISRLFKIKTLEDFILIKKFFDNKKNIINSKSFSLIKKFNFEVKKIKKHTRKELIKKRLVILGGSHDQTGTIQMTNNLKIRSIVFDKDINSPNKMLSDHFIFKSATNTKDIIKFAKKTDVQGVILQGPDFPQVSSAIEKSLGKKNIPLKAAKICTDKYKMKKLFKKASIPIPKFFLYKENNKKKFNLHYPVVIKPVDKSGSRGVLLCENINQFSKLKKKSLSETNKKYLQVEEYLAGPQISTETFILNGKIYTPGFVDRNYDLLQKTKPQILENGGTYPSKHFRYYNQINRYIKTISNRLQIRNGVIKGDIVINKNKVYFIEVAVRLSGGDFSETMIPLSSSFNIIKNSINLSLKNKINKKDLKIKFKNIHFANRYFFSKKGKLMKIDGLNNLKKKRWLKKIKIFKEIGENLPLTTNHSNRLGVFFVQAPTRNLLEKRINEVYKKVNFRII